MGILMTDLNSGVFMQFYHYNMLNMTVNITINNLHAVTAAYMLFCHILIIMMDHEHWPSYSLFQRLLAKPSFPLYIPIFNKV